jgi:hypothetical protein
MQHSVCLGSAPQKTLLRSAARYGADSEPLRPRYGISNADESAAGGHQYRCQQLYELVLIVSTFTRVTVVRRDICTSTVIKPKRLIDADDMLMPAEEQLVRKGEAQLKKGQHVLWDDVKKRLDL